MKIKLHGGSHDGETVNASSHIMSVGYVEMFEKLPHIEVSLSRESIAQQNLVCNVERYEIHKVISGGYMGKLK